MFLIVQEETGDVVAVTTDTGYAPDKGLRVVETPDDVDLENIYSYRLDGEKLVRKWQTAQTKSAGRRRAKASGGGA